MQTLVNTTLVIEEINSNVNVEDFDVSQCYINKPLNFYMIQFGEITNNDLLVFSKHFQAFKS